MSTALILEETGKIVAMIFDEVAAVFIFSACTAL
jgi:hypothetical protein